MAFFEDFTSALKQKWLQYYQANHDWLSLHLRSASVKTPDGGRRPPSYFILGAMNALEPKLAQLMLPFSRLNPDAETLIEVLGLNFDPDIALGNPPAPEAPADRQAPPAPPSPFLVASAAGVPAAPAPQVTGETLFSPTVPQTVPQAVPQTVPNAVPQAVPQAAPQPAPAVAEPFGLADETPSAPSPDKFSGLKAAAIGAAGVIGVAGAVAGAAALVNAATDDREEELSGELEGMDLGTDFGQEPSDELEGLGDFDEESAAGFEAETSEDEFGDLGGDLGEESAADFEAETSDEEFGDLGGDFGEESAADFAEETSDEFGDIGADFDEESEADFGAESTDDFGDMGLGDLDEESSDELDDMGLGGLDDAMSSDLGEESADDEFDDLAFDDGSEEPSDELDDDLEALARDEWASDDEDSEFSNLLSDL